MKVKNLFFYLFFVSLIILSCKENSTLIDLQTTDSDNLTKTYVPPSGGHYEYYPVNGKKIGFWPYFPSGKNTPTPDYYQLKNVYGFSRICVRWTEHLPTMPFSVEEQIVLCGDDTNHWYNYALTNFPGAGSYEIDEPLHKNITSSSVRKWLRLVKKKNANARIGVSYDEMTNSIYRSEYQDIGNTNNINYMYSSYYDIPARWSTFRTYFSVNNLSNYINLDINTNIYQLLIYAKDSLSLNDIILYAGDTAYTEDQLEDFCDQAYQAGWLGKRYVVDE